MKTATCNSIYLALLNTLSNIIDSINAGLILTGVASDAE